MKKTVGEREKEREEREWKATRYRPFPSPLSIATPSKLRLRHGICATVGSWNFTSRKIIPARGPNKEGRAQRYLPIVADENPEAAH